MNANGNRIYTPVPDAFSHQDDDADECALVGCLINDPSTTIAEVGLGFDPQLFNSFRCQVLLRHGLAMLDKGHPVNLLTVTESLRETNDLERVGGAGEVTAICTSKAGMPSTAAYHLDRVRTQAAKRQAKELSAWLEEASANKLATPTLLLEEIGRRQEKIRETLASKPASKWQDAFTQGVLTGQELQSLVVAPREKLLSDWFCESDLGFVFAARGVGKTWLSLLIALAVAEGSAAGPWAAPGKQPVLYIDGEMPLELMQVRDRALARGSNSIRYINHEQLFDATGQVLNLTAPDCQQAVTSLCVEWGTKLLVLDNLSCLFRGVKENDADAWEQILPWLLELRRRKIAVLFVVHAGRNGQMRGTSRREDAAAWVIRLDDAPGPPKPGFHMRGSNRPARTAAAAAPRAPRPSGQPRKADLIRRVATMHDEQGMTFAAIAAEIGGKPSCVFYLYSQAEKVCALAAA